MTSGKRNTIQFILAWVTVFVGLALIFISFFTPPQGDISAGVLAAFGEILTFAGAVIGIDYSYKKKLIQKNDNKDEQI